MAARKTRNKTASMRVPRSPPDPERPQNANLKRGGSPGRPRGLQNKTTRLIKEATLMAAEQVGADGKGLDGLVGYLRISAQRDRKAFLGLLGRILPQQVQHTVGHEHTIHVIAESMTEEQAANEYFRSLQRVKEGGLLIDARPIEASDEEDGEEG